jgi:hypothetical protein
MDVFGCTRCVRVKAGVVCGIAIAASVLLFVLRVGAGATASAAACRVPTLPAGTRAAGAQAARRYVEERHREFGPGLMGYRRGPKLPPATPRERREIADQRAARLQFGLNPSSRLIRRLLRDKSEAVRNSYSLIDIALTPLEVRTVKFELHLEGVTALVDRYSAHCARGDDGGTYFARRRGRGELLVVNVTRNAGHYREAYRARFRYGSLLRVRRVRFSVIALKRVQQKVDRDWSRGDLARLGVDVVSTGIDDQRNAVGVDLSNPSARAAAILRNRYGPAIRMNPRPASAAPAVAARRKQQSA